MAGGNFTFIGGQPRNRIARLGAATGSADGFDPNASDVVFSIAVQADGKILAGTSGFFAGLAGQIRIGVARLERDGRLDQTLNLSAVGSEIRATAIQPDGKIIIGGSFTSILGVARNNIARLNTDGTLDLGFDPNATAIANGNANVLSIAVQSDGKILAGGNFTSIGGQLRRRIARLDAATGAADSFDPNADNAVLSIAVQPDGKILAGGAFANIGGQPRHGLARLDSATGAADAFDPGANSAVVAMTVQPDGKILAGGTFTFIGGEQRNGMARLDATVGLADSFNPNATGTIGNTAVSSIALQPDGKILAAGAFTNIGGQPRNNIARLDATSGAADAFNPNADSFVRSIALEADGKILAGGDFTSVGGQPRNHLARLDGMSGAADAFNPNADNTVLSIAIQADGKILAGGVFTAIGGLSGEPRNLFARLSSATAALSTLTVTQNTITLTRAGAAPLFSRVTFELSTDNGATYTFLGYATVSASSYTLTGLNLPFGQNILIRARGSYRTGIFNGSESIEDKVQLAFLLPTPTQVVSRKLYFGLSQFPVPFDIDLPLAGTVGVECRSGGATNDYQVVFTFLNAVTFSSAAVTSGTGSVSSSDGSGTTIATVNLTGVTNAQTITVTLIGVNNLVDVSAPMGVLLGDANGDRSVNSGDTTITRNRSGQRTSATNFRSDFNLDSTINSGDSTIVRARSGTFVP